MLQNTLRYTGQPHNKECLAHRSVVPRLRNPVLSKSEFKAYIQFFKFLLSVFIS